MHIGVDNGNGNAEDAMNHNPVSAEDLKTYRRDGAVVLR
jgi:hypothetical protein